MPEILSQRSTSHFFSYMLPTNILGNAHVLSSLAHLLCSQRTTSDLGLNVGRKLVAVQRILVVTNFDNYRRHILMLIGNKNET